MSDLYLQIPDGINFIGEFSTFPNASGYPSNTVFKHTVYNIHYAKGTLSAWELYFWPEIQPTPGSVDKEAMVRTISAQFGDGYKLIAVDGINNVLDTWNLSWESLDLARSAWLEYFFKATRGLAFRWTPIGESGILKYNIKGKWNKKRNLSLYESVSVTFERNFSP